MHCMVMPYPVSNFLLYHKNNRHLFLILAVTSFIKLLHVQKNRREEYQVCKPLLKNMKLPIKCK